MVRAAGAAKVVAKEGQLATLRLPSNEIRLISQNCLASIGRVGNIDINNEGLGKAGSKRWLGRRPKVRGSATNPVDHPHGGGEGKMSIGRKKPSTPARCAWRKEPVPILEPARPFAERFSKTKALPAVLSRLRVNPNHANYAVE